MTSSARSGLGSNRAALPTMFSRYVFAGAFVLLICPASQSHSAQDAITAPGVSSGAVTPRSETGGAPHVAVRRERVAQLTGARGGSLKLALQPGKPGMLPLPPISNEGVQYSFLRVRGLPPGFKLSAGFATKDAWLVSLNDAAELMLIPTPGFQDEIILEVLLVRGVETERLSIIRVSVGSGKTPQVDTAALPVEPIEPVPQPQQPPQQQPPLPEGPKRTITPQAEASGLQRAELLLKSSDIAAARMVYETMALKGSAKAAMAMGQTFDPNFLALFPLQGLKPDSAQAKTWYLKAIALGETLAQERLSDLGQ